MPAPPRPQIVRHGGVGRPQPTSRRRPERRPYSSRAFFMTLLCVSIIVAVALLRDAAGSKSLRGGNLQQRQLSPFSKDNLSGDCHLVHDERIKDKCAFVRAHCPDEEAGLISYLDLYFCKMHMVKPVAFILIVLWLATLFLTIGIAASDFFVENLTTIAHLFKMSDPLAGVTLLAFGNGSPDVFSTFAAMGTNSGSLAVGELIGAAAFITAMVAGALALKQPFTIEVKHRKALVREIGFFIIAAAFSLIFLKDGRLHLWECAIMVGYYLFYVMVVGIWHWWGHRSDADERRKKASLSHYGDGVGAEQPEVEAAMTRMQRDGDQEPLAHKRPSLLTATNGRSRASSSVSYQRPLIQPRGSQHEIPLNERHPNETPFIESHNRDRAKSENDVSRMISHIDSTRSPNPRGADTLQVPGIGIGTSPAGRSPSSSTFSTPSVSRRGSNVSNADELFDAPTPSGQAAVPNAIFSESTSRSSTDLDNTSQQQNQNTLLKLTIPEQRPLNNIPLVGSPSDFGAVPRWWPKKVLPPPRILISTLFPSVIEWNEKVWWQKLLGIVSVPSVFLLMITLPVVKTDIPDEIVDQNDADLEDQRAKSASQRSRMLLATNNTSTPESSQPYRDNPSESQIDYMGNQDDYATILRHHHDQIATTPLSYSRSIRSSQGLPLPNTSDPRNIYWNRWLFAIQIFTAPIFIVLISWANTSESNLKILVKPILVSLVCSLLALLALLKTTTPNRAPRWRHGLCFLGFIVAILWISTLANEVVGVLKWLGVILDISDAILGLTIFAVGNSVGDFVANTAVANAETPRPNMALTACFAGPMLNILIGIGVSGGWMTIKGARHHQKKHPGSDLRFKPYTLEISSTLLISGATLLLTLLGFLIVLPRRRWAMDRVVGWSLIGLWIVSTIINVLAEIMGWHRDIR